MPVVRALSIGGLGRERKWVGYKWAPKSGMKTKQVILKYI